MEQRTFAPRRILTFLLITAALTATGVAAAGFGEVDPALPAEFHPAQPLPGDRAEYAYTRIAADGTQSTNALAFLRFEVLPRQWTWNATGAAVLPRIVRVEEAGYGSYSPDSQVRLEYGWGQAVSTAWLGAKPVWNEQASVDPDVRGSTTFLYESLHRLYGGAPIQSCLLQTLPESFEPDQEVKVPFMFCSGSHGVRHPDEPDPTGRQWHEGAGRVEIGVSTLQAIGRSMTDRGQALVMSGYDGKVQLWYVEDVPYPVQMLVQGDGFQTLHHLVGFQRGHEGPTPPPVGPFPPVVHAAAQPWGPSDAGVDLPFKPSEAWALALEDQGGELRAFLDAHPDAYTERTVGGALPNQEGHAWTFQVRGGDERLALEVRRGERALPADFWLPAAILPETTVQAVDTVDVQDSDGSVPPTLPDLASAAARLRALTGLEPTGFEYSWACNDWVRVNDCESGSGPVLSVSNHTQTSSQDLDPTSESFLSTRSDYRTTTLQSRPDGGIRSLSVSATSFDDAGPLVGTQAPEPESLETSTAGGWHVPSGASVATIGVAAGLLGILYLLWPMIKSGVLGLFSRTQDHDVLQQPGRRAVYDAIQARPGIHLHELARFTGQGKGTVEHHLRKLVEHRQVTVSEGAGYTCYFPVGTDRRLVEAGPALRAASARDILKAIVAEPGSHGGHVAEVVGLNRGTVLHHLRRLEAAGLVINTADGGVSRLFPTTLAKQALAVA